MDGDEMMGKLFALQERFIKQEEFRNSHIHGLYVHISGAELTQIMWRLSRKCEDHKCDTHLNEEIIYRL